MPDWLRDLASDGFDLLVRIERHTTGGGVNLGCGLLLVATIVSVNARNIWFQLLDWVGWQIQRWLEYRTARTHNETFRAKPYPESDKPKLKMTALVAVFAILCPVSILIANA